MRLPAITYTQEALLRFSEVIEREWLITNGLGGYASSTVLGINTRKYHGLLVAALNPPGNRTVCLSKLDEDIIFNEDVYRLGSNDFHDTIYPQGYKWIKEFSVQPNPRYLYELGNVKIGKTIFMTKNENVVTVIYEINNQNNSNLKVRIFPLLTCRYFHTVVDRRKNPIIFTQKSGRKEFEVIFQNPQAKLLCSITDGEFNEKVNWVDHLFYRDEAEREESSSDDCFQPGYFELKIPSLTKKQFAITTSVNNSSRFSTESIDSIGNNIENLNDIFSQEIEQHTEILSKFYQLNPTVPRSDWLNWILLAADSFVVQNKTGQKYIVAGYHWFETWGRDTFISLPGLLLTTARFSEAKNILKSFIRKCRDGLIPNFVADKTAEPAYNTVDATLWYFNAVFEYLKYTRDFNFVKEELWESLQSIIEYHKNGTLFGIRLDSDGLLTHGSQLTWMDAALDGEEFTPRAGKAVEIQALWYNALRIMELISNKFVEPSIAEKYAKMANKTSESFNEKFWNPAKNCLFDVLEVKGADSSVRPNQIFAVSLDYQILGKEKSAKVVDGVKHQLLTPYGLRTLAQDDPNFVGQCFGNRRSRDRAYHNGTIWPWLLGPFVTAYLKVNNYNSKSREYALNNLILPLIINGVSQSGLGTLCEIYDCNPPNMPRGCISQAWSIAETLRAYIEDVLMIKPKFSSS